MVNRKAGRNIVKLIMVRVSSVKGKEGQKVRDDPNICFKTTYSMTLLAIKSRVSRRNGRSLLGLSGRNCVGQNDIWFVSCLLGVVLGHVGLKMYLIARVVCGILFQSHSTDDEKEARR